MPRLTQTAQHGAHSGSTIESGDDVQMEVGESSKSLPVSSTKKSKSTFNSKFFNINFEENDIDR